MSINSKIKIITTLILLMFFTGCSSMSKDECRNADWQIKGLEDASQGYPLSRIAEHSKACARVKVMPVMHDYEAGHKKGARLYCVPEKGYSNGRQGLGYQGICPKDLEPSFLRAYRDGQELYRIQSSIDKLADDAADLHSRIHANQDQIRVLKADIVDSNSNASERQYKLRQIDELHHDITNLEVRIDRVTHELNLFNNDLRLVEDKHFRMGYVK